MSHQGCGTYLYPARYERDDVYSTVAKTGSSDIKKRSNSYFRKTRLFTSVDRNV